jgi:hypothetical protein
VSIRPVKRLAKSKPTLEGAGVHLRRAFGFGKTSDFDPFLLLDDFRNDIPEDYLAGFPWHPHRGIETITYVLAAQTARVRNLSLEKLAPCRAPRHPRVNGSRRRVVPSAQLQSFHTPMLLSSGK